MDRVECSPSNDRKQAGIIIPKIRTRRTPVDAQIRSQVVDPIEHHLIFGAATNRVAKFKTLKATLTECYHA
jgi:hypothetical protein